MDRPGEDKNVPRVDVVGDVAGCATELNRGGCAPEDDEDSCVSDGAPTCAKDGCD